MPITIADLGILVVGVALQSIIGFVWYMPQVFGSTFVQLHYGSKTPNTENLQKAMIATIVGAFMMQGVSMS